MIERWTTERFGSKVRTHGVGDHEHGTMISCNSYGNDDGGNDDDDNDGDDGDGGCPRMRARMM